MDLIIGNTSLVLSSFLCYTPLFNGFELSQSVEADMNRDSNGRGFELSQPLEADMNRDSNGRGRGKLLSLPQTQI